MLFQGKLKGLVVSSPSFAPLAKNSTLATVPSVSLASAARVRSLPALNLVLLAGLLRATKGGLLKLTAVMAAACKVTLPSGRIGMESVQRMISCWPAEPAA